MDILDADKMDIFFLDSASETLVSLNNSNTPLTSKQKALGMDRLPLANGGSVVEVFLSGLSYFNNHVDRDPNELRAIKDSLGVKSQMVSVFRVQTHHRGVILVASAKTDYFSSQDLRFIEAVARWVGLVVARDELVERMNHERIEPSQGPAADELLTIMAHSLRNYLMPLQVRLEMIEDRARREGRDKDKRDAESSLHTLHLLTRGISDVLDIARLNQGLFAINPEPMNLIEGIQEVVAAFGSEQASIYVQAPTKVILIADPQRVRQALEDMLAYGVSQEAPRTKIRIDVSIEQRRDGPWVLLTVQHEGSKLLQLDNGQLALTDSRSLHISLGLFLAGQIASAHRGTFTIDFPESHETRLIFAFPVEEEELVVRD
jgi:K+-sensing histidine kinase KdpD